MNTETFRYYYGTFTNWFDDGNEEVFAVANADEIPASCKNLRQLEAGSHQEALDAATQIHRDSYQTIYAEGTTPPCTAN
jgi:hypothetical protein